MSAMLSFLLLPFAASVAFVLIHTYFGVHVLRRRIVFADLALAQLSALGATIAFANGYATTSVAGFTYAFLFTALGAALLTLTRTLARVVSQEAFVGILYVVATAATVLVIDRSPQGAEHVKQMLIGSILLVDVADVMKFAGIYAAIGALHWLFRRPLLALSNADGHSPHRATVVWAWDFLFYVSFGIVVTSSVSSAGVLLVFSFLIVPAVIGFLFSDRFSVVLVIGWTAGVVASAAGLLASYALDLPTGAAIVTTLAIALVLAGFARLLLVGPAQVRAKRARVAVRCTVGMAFSVVLASAIWLVINPAADQPLLAVIESATATGATHFLSDADRETFLAAKRDTVRFQGEVDRLNAREQAARYGTVPLSDDEVRRIASYQQSFNEMVRGERFVQDVLRAKARARERWLVGVPAIALALLGLAWLARTPLRDARRESRRPASRSARAT